MELRKIDHLQCNGTIVLVRVNYDVTYDAAGKINDDSRLRKSLPTLRVLLAHGAAKLILLSHLGRPKAGQFDPQLSLANATQHLEQLMGEPVGFVPERDLRNVRRDALPPQRVVLLENTRFSPGEKENDAAFAKHLASLGDRYVNDAFPAMHRADASIVGIPQHLPAAPGLLVEQEVMHLTPLLDPQHPYYVLIAGKKADKIEAIADLLQRADKVIIGGMLANTFFVAKGIGIGVSKYDAEGVALAKELLKSHADRIVLPETVVAIKDDADSQGIYPVGEVPDDWMIVDIAPDAVTVYQELLSDAKTILWCGPPGMFDKGHENGTSAIAAFIAEMTAKGAYTVVGGGESSEAVVKYGYANKVSFNSTGGGATLEFARGKPLPGIVALEENLQKFP